MSNEIKQSPATDKELLEIASAAAKARSTSGEVERIEQLTRECEAARRAAADMKEGAALLARERDEARAEVERLKQKGEGLCHQNGNLLIEIHDVKRERDSLRTQLQAEAARAGHMQAAALKHIRWVRSIDDWKPCTPVAAALSLLEKDVATPPSAWEEKCKADKETLELCLENLSKIKRSNDVVESQMLADAVLPDVRKCVKAWKGEQ